MGKAIMGTGEAEGEKRAEEATNAALNNPLIDEYSLRGAKGLLVNITGGNDLTLFEVDEVVNKIRAEVDPEAELNVGAIEDKNLNGKIRVSIIATSLDGQEPERKPVISMVHRLQNRNMGYVDHPINTATSNQPTLNATEGATALDMNAIIEQNQTKESELATEPHQVKTEVNEPLVENISMENATYLQNMENLSEDESNTPTFEVDSIELATPELFSDSVEDSSFNQDNNINEPNVFKDANSQNIKEDEIKEPKMFEENNQEEDFEIPAFLRRQKN